MAAAYEVVIVEGQDRIGRIKELWVEDNLDAVGRVVEELNATDLVQDRILRVVEHVVRDNGRQTRSFHSKQAAPQQDAVLARDKLLFIGKRLAVVPFEGSFEKPATDTLLNHRSGVVEGLDDGLSPEGLDSQRRGLGGHNNKGDNSHFAASALESVVKACERLNEHVDTLISVFVSSCGEDVQRIVWVKVVMSVEVAANKVVNLLLRYLMQILELVHGGELGHVETVGQDTVGFPLQQMLRLEGSDVRDSREDIARVGGSPFNAVSVIDASLASLCVYVKVLQVVVEINGASAEISSEESGVRGEDGGDIDATLLA